MSKNKKIYLSYHANDSDEARQIQTQLMNDGWWHIVMIQEGDKTTIETMRAQDIFMPVLSRSYAMDAYLVLNEFSYAATVIYALCMPVWKESMPVIQEAVKDKELLSALEMMTARYLNKGLKPPISEAAEALQQTLPSAPSKRYDAPMPHDKPCSAYTQQNRPDEKESYLFISYAHQDAADVYGVIRELYEAGWDLWYDEGIKPTKQYLPTISHNLRNCSIFVLMLTDVCVYRPFVIDYEVEYAKWLGVPIVTVLLRGDPAWKAETITPAALLPRIALEARKIDFMQKEVRQAASPSLQNNVIYDIPMPQVPGFTFSVQGDRLTLVAYTGMDAAVTVPGVVPMPDGKPYRVEIGKGAFVSSNDLLTDDFEWRDPLVSVHIAEGVTTIGDAAFQGCLNLTEVTIPNSVTYIGERAFSGCSYLKRVTIPPSVTHIGRKAFSQCKALEHITIPGGVKRLGMSVFEGCVKLKSVVIAEGIASIPEHMFAQCAFAAITIPESVTSIGADAFEQCSHLRHINLSKSLSAIGNHAFLDCSRLAHITIPAGVTKIENDTFRNCASLTRVVLPESVSRINARAFAHCGQLSDVFIPKSVIHIGEHAFQNGMSLPAEILRDANEAIYIAPNAFKGTSIAAQSEIDFAWDDIFDTGSDDSAQAFNELLQGDDWKPETATIVSLLPPCADTPRALVVVMDEDAPRKLTEKQTIADFVTELYWEGYNVHYSGFSDDQIDDCAYTMAFLTCKAVASEIVLGVLEKAIQRDPTKVILVILENGAFLPDALGAAMRGHQAILKMNNTDMGLTSEIRRILKDEAFKCHNERPRGFEITETRCEGAVCATLTHFNPTGFGRVVIPQSFTGPAMSLRKIGAWAFDNDCDALEAIVIPEGVTEIEHFAFVSCRSLKSIVIPKSVEKIGASIVGDWVVMYAYPDSAAARYAQEYQIPLQII